MGWSETKASVLKIIGKEGKFPKFRVDPATLYPPVQKAFDAFEKSRTGLEKALLDLENALSSAKNTIKQCADIVEGDDFGLDKDDGDNKKKIEQATKTLLDFFENAESNCDSNNELLEKLDRVLTDLRRLKDVKI